MANTQKVDDTAGVNKIPVEEFLKLELIDAALFLRNEKVAELELKEKRQLEEMQTRLDQEDTLRKMLQVINAHVNEDEVFDCTDDPEKLQLIEAIKELGVEVADKTRFEGRDVQRLIDNIRLKLKSFADLSDVQSKVAQATLNEKHQFIQLAMRLLQPYHEVVMAMARKMS